MDKQIIELNMEEVGQAIADYVLNKTKKNVLRIGYNVQASMTDNAEPYPSCKLVGIIVETI